MVPSTSNSTSALIHQLNRSVLVTPSFYLSCMHSPSAHLNVISLEKVKLCSDFIAVLIYLFRSYLSKTPPSAVSCFLKTSRIGLESRNQTLRAFNISEYLKLGRLNDQKGEIMMVSKATIASWITRPHCLQIPPYVYLSKQREAITQPAYKFLTQSFGEMFYPSAQL